MLTVRDLRRALEGAPDDLVITCRIDEDGDRWSLSYPQEAYQFRGQTFEIRTDLRGCHLVQPYSNGGEWLKNNKADTIL
jgi:hypothetical protein